MSNLSSMNIRRPLLVALIAGIVAAGASLFLNQHYLSSVSVLPATTKTSGAGLLATAGALGLGGVGNDETPYIEVLQSRWLAERLLTAPREFKMGWGLFGSSKPYKQSLLEYMDNPNMDRAVRLLPGIYSVNQDMKTGLLTIGVETRSPQLSQQVAQHAGQLLAEYVTERQQTKGGAKSRFIRKRIQELKTDALAAEAKFVQFLQSNRNYQTTTDPAIRLTGARLELELQTRRQVLTGLELSLEQALQQEKDDTPLVNILDPGHLPTEKSRPARALIVLLVMAVVGIATGVWDNRPWLRTWLTRDAV